MASNSKTRFSDRVDNYIKYRPGYPNEIIDYLKAQDILKADSIIADIGSGTGISSELFLKNGNTAYGVEPNKEMRGAAERLLAGYTIFKSIIGTAEETTLPNTSIDLISAGQAFHWFDIPKAKTEFKRILRPGGFVVLIWNEKQLASSPFMKAYEEMLLKYGTDYAEVKHENIDESMFNSFFDHGFKLNTFPNEQMFDFIGIKGRLLSSSYAPATEHPEYAPLIEELQRIFNKYNENGTIRFEYITRVYTGKLT